MSQVICIVFLSDGAKVICRTIHRHYNNIDLSLKINNDIITRYIGGGWPSRWVMAISRNLTFTRTWQTWRKIIGRTYELEWGKKYYPISRQIALWGKLSKLLQFPSRRDRSKARAFSERLLSKQLRSAPSVLRKIDVEDLCMHANWLQIYLAHLHLSRSNWRYKHSRARSDIQDLCPIAHAAHNVYYVELCTRPHSPWRCAFMYI